MIILGVDPGTNFTGFGVINYNKNNFNRITHGLIKLPPSKPLSLRLEIIYNGVSILAAVHNKIPTSEYSPREIKKSIVGNGAASKEQVSFMIKTLLEIKTIKMKYDESDALAIALCHAFRLKTSAKKSRDWKSFVEAFPERIVNE